MVPEESQDAVQAPKGQLGVILKPNTPFPAIDYFHWICPYFLAGAIKVHPFDTAGLPYTYVVSTKSEHPVLIFSLHLSSGGPWA